VVFESVVGRLPGGIINCRHNWTQLDLAATYSSWTHAGFCAPLGGGFSSGSRKRDEPVMHSKMFVMWRRLKTLWVEPDSDSTILSVGSLFINLVSTGFGVFCLAVLSENIQDAASMFMIREKFLNFRMSLIIINIQPIVIAICSIQCVYPISAGVRGTLMHNQESFYKTIPVRSASLDEN